MRFEKSRMESYVLAGMTWGSWLEDGNKMKVRTRGRSYGVG